MITTATVLSVRYSVADAQERNEVLYEVDTEDVVGQDVVDGSVELTIGDQISRVVFEDVREQVESGEMDVIGLMVPTHLLPLYLGRYDDELEVYPL